MSTWWVNQGETFEQEVRGGYLWSPKKEKGGNRSSAYDNMAAMKKGDTVFSYLNKQLNAVGVVVSEAVSSPQPDAYGDRWEQDGWFVEVDFTVSETPYSPKSDWEEIKNLFPTSIKPLTRDGYGNQKVYLSKISDELGSILLTKLQPGFITVPFEIEQIAESEYFEESEIWHNLNLEDTEREAIVMARSGQGKFRKRVASFEKACRVTGISDPKFLVASHIKPWRLSTPNERLDGNNGLMLSPHVDHLFDSGLISFESSGKILASSSIPRDLFERWGINKDMNVGNFTNFQKKFLYFHNKFVFKQ
jgi:hypothetical protein